MTRPASFNKTWGYEALQIADENNEKTQEFMRTGWEGGSDKKAPSASVQNYHMQKTDQALQEIERQGYLSWRNDVPYSKGARVFFHGSTFHALKDNQDIEPQGSRDNGVWYLIPVQVYPTRYGNVEGLKSAATHDAEEFEKKGSTDLLRSDLKKVAFTGQASDAIGYFPWSKLSDIPAWIRSTHDDNGVLYMRATDGTQYRLGNGYYDLFDKSGNVVFTIDPAGRIVTGTVPIERIVGLKDGATMSKSNGAWTDIAGSDNEILTTKQFVEFFRTFESKRGNGSGVSHGYQKLPSGLIIQWGYEAGVNSNGAGFTSFLHYIQYPFPNNMLFAMGNMYSPGNSGWDNLKIWPNDRNTFNVKRETSLSNPFDYSYLCIGY